MATNETKVLIDGRDYRDVLTDIIQGIGEEHKRSIYRISKDIGINQSSLNNILRKRRHASLLLLEEMLDYAGYDLVFVKKAPVDEVSAV